jgi:ubiquinone/menaquinone biosynthesis C-methylase UbiE
LIRREKGSADNIEFLEGTAEEPPLQQFDAVFSNFVLHKLLISAAHSYTVLTDRHM